MAEGEGAKGVAGGERVEGQREWEGQRGGGGEEGGRRGERTGQMEWEGQRGGGRGGRGREKRERDGKGKVLANFRENNGRMLFEKEIKIGKPMLKRKRRKITRGRSTVFEEDF